MSTSLFPDEESLKALKELVNQSDDFHSLGTIDCRVGFKSGDNVTAVTFQSYSCTEVATWDVDRLRELDFWIEMDPSQWSSMVNNIKEDGRANSCYRLNSLDLSTPGGIIHREDQSRGMKFYQYICSLQEFVDSVRLLNKLSSGKKSGENI